MSTTHTVPSTTPLHLSGTPGLLLVRPHSCVTAISHTMLQTCRTGTWERTCTSRLIPTLLLPWMQQQMPGKLAPAKLLKPPVCCCLESKSGDLGACYKHHVDVIQAANFGGTLCLQYTAILAITSHLDAVIMSQYGILWFESIILLQVMTGDQCQLSVHE